MHISKKLDSDVANWVSQSIGKGAKLTSIIPAKGATSSSVYFIKSAEKSECGVPAVLMTFLSGGRDY